MLKLMKKYALLRLSSESTCRKKKSEMEGTTERTHFATATFAEKWLRCYSIAFLMFIQTRFDDVI